MHVKKTAHVNVLYFLLMSLSLSVSLLPHLHTLLAHREDLPVQALQLAFDHAATADLCIVFGSSLTVSPACHVPRDTVANKNAGKLVVINLQTTPLDDICALRIFGMCICTVCGCIHIFEKMSVCIFILILIFTRILVGKTDAVCIGLMKELELGAIPKFSVEEERKSKVREQAAATAAKLSSLTVSDPTKVRSYSYSYSHSYSHS